MDEDVRTPHAQRAADEEQSNAEQSPGKETTQNKHAQVRIRLNNEEEISLLTYMYPK